MYVRSLLGKRQYAIGARRRLVTKFGTFLCRAYPIGHMRFSGPMTVATTVRGRSNSVFHTSSTKSFPFRLIGVIICVLFGRSLSDKPLTMYPLS